MRNILYRLCTAKLAVNFVSTPVTTAAWVQVDAALDNPFVAVEILNTSNAVLKMSTGAAAAEDASELLYYILPGKSMMVPLEGAKGKPLSLKAVGSVDADIGDLYINYFG